MQNRIQRIDSSSYHGLSTSDVLPLGKVVVVDDEIGNLISAANELAKHNIEIIALLLIASTYWSRPVLRTVATEIVAIANRNNALAIISDVGLGENIHGLELIEEIVQKFYPTAISTGAIVTKELTNVTPLVFNKLEKEKIIAFLLQQIEVTEIMQ